MAPILFSPGNRHKEKGMECFFCFIWVLKVSLRLTPIEKGGLCPLRLLPIMIELSVCAPSGYSTRRTLFWRTKKLYAKNEGYESKIILGGLNCTMDKIDRDDENKTQRLYRWCCNYSRVPSSSPFPPPIANFSIFFHIGRLYSNPAIINFPSFFLTFLSVNSHFHHSPS